MNKIQIVAAAAAFIAAGTAQALTPAQVDAARATGALKEIRIAGASALRLSVAAYIAEICTPALPATSDLHVFFDNGTGGTNHRAYACTLGVAVGSYAAGTPVLIYKRDLGGSGQGVQPIITQAVQEHQNVSAASCTVPTNPTPGDNPAISDWRCTGFDNIKSDAGISDLEPAILNASVNTGAVISIPALSGGPLVQALFGVAVNLKTYRALQEAQGIIAPGAPLLDLPAPFNPSLPGTGNLPNGDFSDSAIATVPSLPREWITGALTQFASGGAANARGWNIVIPDRTYSLDDGANVRPAVDAGAAAKTINVCRRARGSGTQAASNAFFLQNPCNSGPAAFPPSGSITANATTTAATVVGGSVFQSGGSAGEVEDCLTEVNTTAGGADNTAYGFGILGRESNPRRVAGNGQPLDRQYRYVKINGQAPFRTEAKAGRYGFVYEATMQWNPANTDLGDKVPFLTALRTGFGTPTALAAVDPDTQQGVMSPPTAYAGSYDSYQPGGVNAGNTAVQRFGSRTSRLANLSCAPLRDTK